MRTRMKGVERRAAIVRSAVRLFAEKGFRGTTTRELAAAVGVTEPVLYRHFRNKRELYAAIIEERAPGASLSAGELRLLARGADDRAFFTALGTLVLDRYEKDPDMSRLLLYSCLEPHELAGMFFERLFQDSDRLVAGYIRRRVRAGAFRNVDPVLAARGVIGMISYQGLARLLFPGKVGRPDRRLVDQMVTLFLTGISIR